MKEIIEAATGLAIALKDVLLVVAGSLIAMLTGLVSDRRARNRENADRLRFAYVEWSANLIQALDAILALGLTDETAKLKQPEWTPPHPGGKSRSELVLDQTSSMLKMEMSRAKLLLLESDVKFTSQITALSESFFNVSGKLGAVDIADNHIERREKLDAFLLLVRRTHPVLSKN